MLSLIEFHSIGCGSMSQYAAYSGIEPTLFGCVAREERRLRQRRKRGCKSRRIHLSPDPSLVEGLRKLHYEKRQPAVSRKFSLAYTISTPLSVYHRLTLADARNDRRPAGHILVSQDSDGSGNWSALIQFATIEELPHVREILSIVVDSGNEFPQVISHKGGENNGEMSSLRHDG